MTAPRLLIFGAHPDDAELNAGGLMHLYRQQDWPVKVISATDGQSGHHTAHGPELAKRRAAELKASCGTIGAEAETWPNPDGYLQPTIKLRLEIIREIRRYQPDLVLTHRTIDYHPDHRALAQAVQDAAYMVTVPAIAPEVPHLRADPVVAFMNDRFTRPSAFTPDVVVEIQSVEPMLEMMHQHASQVYEWLPHNWRLPKPPEDEPGRQAWLREHIIEPRWRGYAEQFRPAMAAQWGEVRAKKVTYAEAFEIGEHGSPLTDELRARLFSF